MQEPLCLAGTVRDNLDPDGLHSDADLERVLRACCLLRPEDGAAAEETPHPPGVPGNRRGDADAAFFRVSLSTQLEAGGRNWSVGQRQLLSVARALLLPVGCRVVCLDEATAAQDPRSEAALWRVIRDNFADAAVLCVAHRLSNLLACDRVLVLADGVVVEEGHPAELLGRAGGRFAALAHAQGSEGCSSGTTRA